jgi:L-aspartate oxidase
VKDRVATIPAATLVVGSGLAGLSAALGLERCTVLTRGKLGRGSSSLAQGGIAAALDASDAPSKHAADTVAVAGGIGDSAIAEAVTAAAAGRVSWLRSLGARFDTEADGAIRLGREAGHSARRIVHADGDATGAEVMRALLAAARARPDIELVEEHRVVDLLLEDGRAAGVLAVDAGGVLRAFTAPAVILATGGIGGLYRRTTNPAEVTGDGLAIAARAGVELADLEFVQFHPTALDLPADPLPLLSEALRGEGAVLVNDLGERFMPAVHPAAELAPRDVVARAIWGEQARGRRVYLDATQALGAKFAERFPTIWRIASAAGIDPASEPLPVTPAEHYHMGGIATDIDGRTSLPGLWAAGEVAATGLHGANRLASNSLLEAMVFGAAVSRSVMASAMRRVAVRRVRVAADALRTRRTDEDSGRIVEAIRDLMWQHVGLMRDESGLRTALTELRRLAGQAADVTERNACLAARLITAAALQRRESRGAHWRLDHPRIDARWSRRSFVIPLAARTARLSAAPSAVAVPQAPAAPSSPLRPTSDQRVANEPSRAAASL